MSLTGVVQQAERRGETLFQADPSLSSDLRKGDVVSDLEHIRAHARSAIAKVEEYQNRSPADQANLITHLEIIDDKARKTAAFLRKVRK